MGFFLFFKYTFMIFTAHRLRITDLEKQDPLDALIYAGGINLSYGGTGGLKDPNLNDDNDFTI
jgi:hypothetical protein